MRIRLSLLVGLTAGALVAAMPAVAVSEPRPVGGDAAGHPADQRVLHPQHTSGDAAGWIAPALPWAARRAPARRSSVVSWTVVPGVTYTRWSQTDAPGPIRAHLLTVDLKARGVGLNYATTKRVAQTARTKRILNKNGAIAGVNGDFFDIGRTGAPLGLGAQRGRKVLHGRTSGWNAAFYIDRNGRPEIGDLPMRTKVTRHPRIRVSSLNAPYVEADSIGAYTKAWGPISGYSMTNGQRHRVRVVWIRKNRVVKGRKVLKAGRKIRGTILVGRGAGAKQLRKLKKGSRIKVKAALKGRPRMAITGNRTLVDDGVITVVDNREMHPRTAVGIDRDTGEVLLLVVDGRQSDSRGYTMVELANLMIDLGADEALNLDGGGSSTLVARNSAGRNQVFNNPSGGAQRWVTNALAVTYRDKKRG